MPWTGTSCSSSRTVRAEHQHSHGRTEHQHSSLTLNKTTTSMTSSLTWTQTQVTRTCSGSSQRRESNNLSKLVASANPVLNASVIDADEVAIWLQIAMRRATLTEALLTHEGCRHDKKAMLKTTTTSESHSQPWSWSQVQVTLESVTYVDWSQKKILGKGGMTHGVH